MKIKNGDLPAMPMWCEQLERQLHGLTKREYFAAMAMQGLLSGTDGDSALFETAPDWVRNIAEASVEFSDALLAELERTK